MLLTTLAFVASDSFAKHLIQSYSVVQIVWGRYLFTVVLALLLTGRRLPETIVSRRPWLQILRGILALMTSVLFFAGLRFIPLADATALAVTAPIIVAVLSMPMLGERVGPRQWVGVAAGFLGALIIVHPGVGVLQWAGLFPLAAAFGVALHQITARVVTRTDSALTTFVYTAFVGALATSVAVPWVWVTPQPLDWLYMAAVGLLGGIGHFTLIKAFEAAPAAMVAPFSYSSLIWAAFSGLFVFGDLPGAWTVAGAVVIVASGLYVQRRKRAQR